ncbi:MAG: glycosyltransferase 87 family protein [Candidatus Krumholzibacteriia bacterium]
MLFDGVRHRQPPRDPRERQHLDPDLYWASSGESEFQAKIRATFTIDHYQYPPPFLILPRSLSLVTGDFLRMRALRFALGTAAFLTALAVVAVWCGAARSNPELLVLPLLVAAPATLATLQIGNFQLMAISLAMLGMVAFERKHDWLGGLLLGFSMLSKVFPGILLVYLILQRRWRPVIWTAGASLAILVVTLSLFGAGPVRDFVTFQVPRIASGDVFAFFTKAKVPRTVMANTALFGLPYKLEGLGLTGFDSYRVAQVLTHADTLGLAVLLVLLARARRALRAEAASGVRTGPGSPLREAQTWLALLTLAQLRSPFLPWTYGIIATMWLLLLVLPRTRHRIWKTALVGVAWVLLAVNVPFRFGPDSYPFHLGFTFVGVLGILLFNLTVVTDRIRHPDPPPG